MTAKRPFWVRREPLNTATLEKLCIAAMKETKNKKRLAGLRPLQQHFLEHPETLPDWYMHFLDEFLRTEGLTEHDLQKIEAMGNVLKSHQGSRYQPEDIWYRMFNARAVRGEEHQALALLVRIYNDPITRTDMKQRCVQALVSRKALADEHLTIYAHYLQYTDYSPTASDMCTLLIDACAVDFGDDTSRLLLIEASALDSMSERSRLEQVAPLAQSCAAHGIKQIAEVATTQGLHALLIERSLGKATTFFKEALTIDARHKLARTGLFVSLLRQGAYDVAVHTAQQFRQPIPSLAAGLTKLSMVLHWLESADIAGPPPANADTLERLNLYWYGGLVYMTIGRLHLLEGHAHQALNAFESAVFKPDGPPQWLYYLAWANVLVGKGERVVRCLEWSRYWIVACLLLDVDPTLAKQQGVLNHDRGDAAISVPPAYASAFQFRIAQAQSTHPAPVQWKAGTGSLEEDMEALRSVLGFAFYTKDKQHLGQSLALPLFQRLPLADQKMWRGLHALLMEDQAQGEVLLEQAAIRHGHRHAALILSVHLLGQKQIAKAKQLLDVASGERTDFKINLLLAYIDICEGKIDTATKQLGKMADSHQTRTYYALGNLNLYHAKEAQRLDLSKKAQYYYERAAMFFDQALKMKKYNTLPADCEARSRAMKFIVSDNKNTEVHLREQKQKDVSENGWNDILIRLCSHEPSIVAIACEDLLDLLQHVQHLKDTTVIGLAQLVARACTQAETIEQAGQMLALLNYLTTISDHRDVKHLYQQSVARTARLRYTKVDECSRDPVYQQITRFANVAPDNFCLALLSASISMQRQDQAQAVAVLSKVNTQDTLEQRLCALLMHILTAAHSALDLLSQPQTYKLPPAFIPMYNILKVVGAFAANMPDQGYQTIRSILLAGETEPILPIIDIHRLASSLCVYSQKQGHTSPHIIKIATRLNDIELFMQVARSLINAGEMDNACLLWEKALAQDHQPDNPQRHEFTKFLCHLAVISSKEGCYLKAAQRLRLAATFNSSSNAPDVKQLEQFADKLELQEGVKRLLTHCSGEVAYYIPGRYYFLETLVEQHPTLLQALLHSDNNKQVQGKWTAIQKNSSSDVRFVHGLAVLYREQVLLSIAKQKFDSEILLASTFLWALLLCTPKFWEHFAQTRTDATTGEIQVLGEQRQAELMDASLDSILSLHSSAGSVDFAAGRYNDASLHLRCLHICRSGSKALIKALTELDINYKFSLDNRLVKQLTEQAEKYFTGWCNTMVYEATDITTNPEAIKQLPDGIRKNYEGGIFHLEPFIKLLNKLHIPIPQTFLVCLEWYAEWSIDLYVSKDDATFISQVQAARPLADLLIPLCSKNEGCVRPEQQAISWHLTCRAMIAPVKKALPLLQEALEWSPHDGATQSWVDLADELELILGRLETEFALAARIEFIRLGLTSQVLQTQSLLYLSRLLTGTRTQQPHSMTKS
jgi:hypothetical protein